MDALRGSMGLNAGLAVGGLVSTWAAPIVCEVFESGPVVESVERGWKVGAERRSMVAVLSEV